LKVFRKFYVTFFLFACTFFFFGWLFYKSFNPTLPSESNPTVFYSNQQRDDLRWMLYKAINNAKKSIKVIMFGFTEPSILHILSLKAKTIPVTIYYDANNSTALEKILPNVQAYPIKKSAFMHQKILVIDNSQIFIGSANFTTSSLVMHDNLIIGLYNPKIAKFILEKCPLQNGYFNTYHSGRKLEFWLLPDPRGNGLNAVLKTLRKAVKSIKIAIFTFTHPGVIQELILAKKRGVKVEVTIDFGASLGISSKSIKKLKDERINVLVAQGTQLLHHKFILIDDKTLITGSANLTKAAFYKNNDCFLIMSLQDNQEKFMLTLWDKIISEAR
jgi:phosphatidylserine/phosphatidylglycerophosphate/cardiolipin synthase-like enzyme